MSQPPRAPEPPLKFPPYVPQRVREYVAGLFEAPGLRPEHADTLRRLTGDDPRMREAWTRLARIARTDEDYVLFVLAAWWARDNYGEWREWTRQASELAGRIAETARELAGLLRQIEQNRTEPAPLASAIQITTNPPTSRQRIPGRPPPSLPPLRTATFPPGRPPSKSGRGTARK